MIVVDACVLATALGDDDADGDRTRRRLRHEQLAAPELIDLEVSSALRRLVLAGRLPLRRAELAIAALASLPRRRGDAPGAPPALVQPARKLPIYEAAYVALAEQRGTTL